MRIRFLAGLAIGFALTTCVAKSVADDADDYPIIALAQAFREFEIALKVSPLEGEDVRRVNLAMDRAAFTFFSGDYNAVARQVNELTLDRRFGSDVPDSARIAINTRAVMRPQPWLLGSNVPPSVELVGLGVGEDVEPQSFALRLRSIDGNVGHLINERLFLPGDVTLEFDASLLRDAFAYDVFLVSEEPAPFRIGSWSILEESISSQRRRWEAKLDLVSDESLATARDLCRQRIEMLAGEDANDLLTRWVLTPWRVSQQIDREVASLASGHNPYVNQAGDAWHTFTIDGLDVPMRICRPFLPPTRALPVVLALHGAGGNEHLFFEGYGRALPALADFHGFLAVSPLTYNVPMTTDGFELLLNQLDSLHTIDRDRVYVIGHSLGAMMASGLVARHSDSIAAMCGIAGTTRGAGTVPTLLYGAEFDTIVRITEEDLARVADPDAEIPVETRMVKDYGHVLIVNAVLSDAIEWLLKFDRSDRR